MKSFALAAVLVTTACASSSHHPAREPAPLEVHTFTSDGAGFWTNSHWVDTGKEVIVFDAQFTPALAEQVIADIQGHSHSPITTLVITHPNPDKFNGAPAFQKLGAKVIASRATAQAIPGVHAYKKAFFVGAGMFTADSYPAEASVDVVFTGRTSLAGGAVELVELQHSGVSSTQTVALIPGASAIVVGDLVHPRVHAWLEGGIVNGAAQPDLGAWIAALGELPALGMKTVYPGRGEPALVGQAVKEETAYLTRARELASTVVKSGQDMKAMSATMQEQLAAAFPTYAHAELVGYGVYGLLAALSR